VRLLQLSSLEFQQELRTALDTNPFLEYDSSETEDVALATASPGDDAGATPATDTVAATEAEPVPAEASGTTESAEQDDMPGDFFGRLQQPQFDAPEWRRRQQRSRRMGAFPTHLARAVARLAAFVSTRRS
jgi:DNA-directed RNA polymerase specialized sigma54-like protein